MPADDGGSSTPHPTRGVLLAVPVRRGAGGSPLLPGVVARLASARLRFTSNPWQVRWLPDGLRLAVDSETDGIAVLAPFAGSSAALRLERDWWSPVDFARTRPGRRS